MDEGKLDGDGKVVRVRYSKHLVLKEQGLRYRMEGGGSLSGLHGER